MASIKYDFSVDKKDANKQWTFKDVRVDLHDKLLYQPKNNEKVYKSDIEVNYDFDAIEGAIYNIFLFNKGERILRPDFGNSLYQFLYEPITQLTADRIAKEIRTMFDKWEPRVTITGIQVIPNPDQNEYRVVVGYYVSALLEQMPPEGLKFEFTANARRSS